MIHAPRLIKVSVEILQIPQASLLRTGAIVIALFYNPAGEIFSKKRKKVPALKDEICISTIKSAPQKNEPK